MLPLAWLRREVRFWGEESAPLQGVGGAGAACSRKTQPWALSAATAPHRIVGSIARQVLARV